MCRRLRLVGRCCRACGHGRTWQQSVHWLRLSSPVYHVFDEMPVGAPRTMKFFIPLLSATVCSTKVGVLPVSPSLDTVGWLAMDPSILWPVGQVVVQSMEKFFGRQLGSTLIDDEAFLCPVDGSIMITASHLPFNQHGFKFFTNAGGLSTGDIKNVLERASKVYDSLSVVSLKKSEQAATTAVKRVDFMTVYTSYLANAVRTVASNIEKPLPKFPIDAGVEQEELLEDAKPLLHVLPKVALPKTPESVYGGNRRYRTEITGPYKDDPAPTIAQIHCLQFLICAPVSGGTLRKPECLFGNSGNESAGGDLQLLGKFFYKLSLFLHFPLGCSLPWLLTDHVIESEDGRFLQQPNHLLLMQREFVNAHRDAEVECEFIDAEMCEF